jgi:hypothetical protein
MIKSKYKIGLSDFPFTLIKLSKAGLLFFIIFIIQSTNCDGQTDFLKHGKIPIDGSRWYQLNNVSGGMGQLYDGILNVTPNMGYGLILSNWDAWYPVLAGEQINIDSLRFYDGQGTNATTPLTVYVVDSNWVRTPIGVFTGTQYNVWVGPDANNPNVFNLKNPFKNVKYIVINSYGNYPTEIEFYGGYKSPAASSPLIRPAIPLKNYFGANGYEWNFNNANSPNNIDEQLMKAAQSFTGFRHYLDWSKLEPSKGNYCFNPELNGGWNDDTIYQRCKAAGIEVLADIKTIPDWLDSTYPAPLQYGDNVPLVYGTSLTDPNSYILQAKVAFQFAARYGNNKNVNRSLLSVYTVPRWNGDVVNVIKTGMGLVKYIECNNERDKWWKGRQAYQTGREYAANLSAFYDGNKNTMGSGVGVKNADTSIKVVMAGLALPATDYVRGMIDWCKEFRGYKADGTVNLCWDVINYHFYSDNSNSARNIPATRGTAPELSIADSLARGFVNMAHQYAYDMPVWVTEAGYDTKNAGGSTQYAIAIGNKSVLATQADWILRSSLLYARSGVSKLFFYQMYDDNPNGGQYGTSGLLNSDASRRPSADFLLQVNKTFGSFSYKETLSNDPAVDHYDNNGNAMYAIWVPDEKGRTANYPLSLANADSVYIYTPIAGSDTMQLSKQAVVNGSVTIAASETPVFAVPFSTVKILSFTGTAVNSTSVQLNWKVSSDTSITSFSVERQNPVANTFTEITKVTGNMNSTVAASYSYKDIAAINGLNYYRITAFLKNGSNLYSPVINVNTAITAINPVTGNNSFNVYPNPVNNGSLNIEGLTAGKKNYLKLFSAGGYLVISAITTSSSYTMKISPLASGTYYLTADDGTIKNNVTIAKAGRRF